MSSLLQDAKEYVYNLPEDSLYILEAITNNMEFEESQLKPRAFNAGGCILEYLNTLETIDMLIKKSNVLFYRVVRVSRYLTDDGYLIPVEVVKCNIRGKK